MNKNTKLNKTTTKAKKKRDNSKRTRNVQLSLRISSAEKELLKAACKKSNLTITDTLINALKEFLEA